MTAKPTEKGKFSFPKVWLGYLSPEKKKILITQVLVSLGFVAFIYYFSFWFEEGRYRTPLILIGIAGFIAAVPQLLGNWMLYLKAGKGWIPKILPTEFTVDVFVTAYKEPYEIVETTLKAAVAMRGTHKTWLLDDGHDPELERLATSLGAGYLTRTDHKDAKAGNVNAALEKTDGEIIVIFDIDHVPKPDFLEKTLPYFRYPPMGFVQVMLTFDRLRSWVARAAAEGTLDYYNPTSRGADGLGSATLTGSNALIRRTALESIGGYQPGLAEDLATSITLHSKKWHSAYFPEPLAPGLAPPDLESWFTQQLKWARGVFELLIVRYVPSFFHLTWGQRVTYAVRMTYYWIGLVVAFHLFVTIGVLFSGNVAAHQLLHTYLLHLFPLAIVALVNRQAALHNWSYSHSYRGLLWRPTALVYATWPVYTLAWFMAMLRIPLGFRPTPKSAAGGLKLSWIFLQLLSVLLLVIGIIYSWYSLNTVWVTVLLFSLAQILLQLPLLREWLRTRC